MLTRRQWLGALALSPLAASAQPAWRPSRPMRFLVIFARGGSDDRVARLIAGAMAPVLGQPIKVENVVGDLGNRAAAALLEAPADGHTLLAGSSTVLASNAAVFPQRTPFDPLEAFAPVGRVGINTLLLAVPRNRPWRDIAALLAQARANPGAMRVGTAGEGSMSHLYTMALAREAGVRFDIAHLNGGAATVAALTAGEIDFTFTQAVTLLPLVADGRARPMMVGSKLRAVWMPSLMEVPSVEDVLPASTMDATEWWALAARAGTAPEILQALNRVLSDLVDRDEAVRARLAEMGILPTADPSPADFRAFWQADVARWRGLAPLVNATQ